HQDGDQGDSNQPLEKGEYPSIEGVENEGSLVFYNDNPNNDDVKLLKEFLEVDENDPIIDLVNDHKLENLNFPSDTDVEKINKDDDSSIKQGQRSPGEIQYK